MALHHNRSGLVADPFYPDVESNLAMLEDVTGLGGMLKHKEARKPCCLDALPGWQAAAP